MSPGLKPKKGKIRVDQALLDQGLAEALDQARTLIMTGKVLAGDQKIAKASELISPTTQLRIRGQQKSRYVSRGGDKIAAAVTSLQISEVFSGAIVLDVGSSTGGFTDFALQSGAKHVIAVDVGTNQMAWSLRQDSRVSLFESTHIKDLEEQIRTTGTNVPSPSTVDVVVADVSFNSIARLLGDILTLAPVAQHFLVLVKPQFELPQELIPDGGIVVNEEHRKLAVQMVNEAFIQQGFSGGRWINSAIPGKAGNIEIFYYNARQPPQPSVKDLEEDKQ